MNLAYERHLQLQQTLDTLGFSEMPRDPKDLDQVQVHAAKEIGGIRTRMYLDAPREVEKYHFGPFQISLCLLSTIHVEYARLTGIRPVFSDDEMDRFRERNREFLQSLYQLRNSLLHERYENVDVQEQFVKSQLGRLVQLAIEAEQGFQQYLKLLRERLQGGE